ncbi:MAG TPA: quinoprotein dehydrogenase-associated SoxYZ-like carrier [Methylibium sp.]|uniref:quinoprotein dehydrogenase-associated SoxYZ-like carrier n=1 Tax=Methylibium sp. TaxID=2067992 RepID=UPI002DBB8348|nr:quinoprotein dehydrogenase-associated SoxYZ-like carrier [Methylibium sp.]HEU4458305.1 quinoprotein dehydrogenase-associated SoxYZ-like carrier [Methylibium sp.]
MFPSAADPKRRDVLKRAALAPLLPLASIAAPSLHAAGDPFEGDPYKSHPWPDMRREFLGADARVVFDPRVQVRGPVTAENPVVVPISVAVAPGLGPVRRIVALVDRNPIRKVLDFEPKRGVKPAVAFRFKLEQASAVRAAVLADDGLWHVGGGWVDSAGGGCTVSGATRQDGSWTRTLGQVSGKLFADPEGGARLRVRVMHPMDTGLVAGIPAFYLNRLVVSTALGDELLRLATWEPVSENPVFSFDLAQRPSGPLRVSGSDNNGNRIETEIG